MSLEELETRSPKGYVYVIVNDAWPDWVKVGCAKDADDRLNGYQTHSPHRDYRRIAVIQTGNRYEKEADMHKVFEHFSDQRKGEWFKIDRLDAIKLFNYQVKEQTDGNA